MTRGWFLQLVLAFSVLGWRLAESQGQQLCGLRMKKKHPSTRVAGKTLSFKFSLKNLGGRNLNNVAFRIQLPLGTTFKAGSVTPMTNRVKWPTIEGTTVTWRDMQIGSRKSRRFKLAVSTNCGLSGTITFQPSAVVDSVCFADYNPITISLQPPKSRFKQRGCTPIRPEPPAQNTSVADLNRDPSPIPPPGVWTTGGPNVNIDSANAIVPIDFRRQLHVDARALATTYALRQQTFSSIDAVASVGAFWLPPLENGIFNGMLLKTFVTQGFQILYEFNTRAAPAGATTRNAPDVYLLTRSPTTGRSSTFKWDPYYNTDSQGAIVYQAWNTDRMTQATGSNAAWPEGPTGGSGWSCTLNCYLTSNTTVPTSQMRRRLETYVASLSAQPPNSEPRVSIDTAIIEGIQLVLGPEEPDTTAYTKYVTISSGIYSWTWNFGP